MNVNSLFRCRWPCSSSKHKCSDNRQAWRAPVLTSNTWTRREFPRISTSTLAPSSTSPARPTISSTLWTVLSPTGVRQVALETDHLNAPRYCSPLTIASEDLPPSSPKLLTWPDFSGLTKLLPTSRRFFCASIFSQTFFPGHWFQSDYQHSSNEQLGVRLTYKSFKKRLKLYFLTVEFNSWMVMDERFVFIDSFLDPECAVIL